MSEKVNGVAEEKTTTELLDAFENPKVETGYATQGCNILS